LAEAATGATPTAEALAMASSASSTARALFGRCSGFLARSFRISSSRGFAIAPLCQEGATGGVLMCWEMMATASSPSNGARPVSIS
jgi:hypothetical protein